MQQPGRPARTGADEPGQDVAPDHGLEGPGLDYGRVLIVDDDPEIRLLVARFLQRHGYQVAGAPDGVAMMAALAHGDVDLVILDLMLPGRSGFDLCRDVRAASQIPIVMLTARGDEADRIRGLEGGADDYIAKPFSPRELLARVRAVLRRARAASDGRAADNAVVTFDGWVMDLRRRELFSPPGVLIDLSTGEFDLLAVFVEHANRVLSREALMQFAKTRTSDDPFDRTIDVQISRLRRKLGADASGGQLIKTVRGAGYMLAAEARRQHGEA